MRLYNKQLPRGNNEVMGCRKIDVHDKSHVRDSLTTALRRLQVHLPVDREVKHAHSPLMHIDSGVTNSIDETPIIKTSWSHEENTIGSLHSTVQMILRSQRAHFDSSDFRVAQIRREHVTSQGAG